MTTQLQPYGAGADELTAEADTQDEVQPGSPPGAVLSLTHVGKRFGAVDAVQDVSLTVAQGEVVALFGPRGGGLTTLLRAVAGLERVTTGEISYRGKVVDSSSGGAFVPTHKRDIGVVLRPSSLWPHMSVADNVAYPLRVRGVKRPEVRDRVAMALESTGVGGYEQRSVAVLDGAGQLRVAVARALVSNPSLLLMDEPLADLEPEQRDGMRFDLRVLQQSLGVSVLLTTHDDATALSLSDRIALMYRGRIEQVGAPMVLYQNPATEQVRDVFGSVVLLEGVVEETDPSGAHRVRLGGSGGPAIEAAAAKPDGVSPGSPCLVSIRQEDVTPTPLELAIDGDEPNTLRGIIATLLFTGGGYDASVELPWGQDMRLRLSSSHQWRAGQTLAMRTVPQRARVWPVDRPYTSPAA